MKQLLHTSSHIWVPLELALCPYCGAQLGVGFSGFEQNDDGTWSASEIETECGDEPQPIMAGWEELWDDWNDAHSDMPYVYQLPVEMKIMEWVNANYIFDPENENKPTQNDAASTCVATEQSVAPDRLQLRSLRSQAPFARCAFGGG